MCNIVYVKCVPVPIVICFDLPLLTNGTIDYGGAGSNNRRPVNTVATYTCNPGYAIGGDTTRTCRSGIYRVWTGFAPVCLCKWNKLCTYCLLLSVYCLLYS